MDDSTENDGQEQHNIFHRILAPLTRLFSSSDHKSNSASQSKAGSSIRSAPLNSPLIQQKEQRNNRPDRKDKMQTEISMRHEFLKQSIEDGSFWEMPDIELLQLIKSAFPQELERLKNATFLRNPNAPRPAGLSISESLYGRGQEFAEINRTLVGVLALRWIHKGDYETFVGTQGPPPIVLKRDSFDWLCDLFKKGLRDAEDTYALIISMIINDLGKDPTLATDYASLTGDDIPEVNHDMILYDAVKARMVPVLDRLSEQDKDYLVLGIKLGSDFNFGQLAQAENAPASLSGLEEMRGHDRAFEMRFMEQLLDLAGASGHEDWTCAKKMIEPIFQSYKNVYDVAHGIIQAQMSLREGYDIILKRKLKLLHEAGYPRQFDIQDQADRALMRLFCLGNTSNSENADVFYVAFMERLAEEVRETLVHGLNVDGSVEAPAVQPTYLPAMLTKALGNTLNGTQEEKIKAVTAVLRYLTRCMVVEASRLKKLPHRVTVVERDVRKISPVLESEEFKHNPDILDREDIPEDQIANMARDSEERTILSGG
ncbi:uncharacterized protein Z520_08918 [Fonsecaea multimorphosa CBS 102226]|uniref:Uncharacterized protein n=1 Tax=Fonsecaea multimorphosa CBS 102226 TaxID=1442371 RepID=A0A0D2IE68_9EURO|nr:uncharacterized protein Z520_08918 [Fonsecaea multimorphosa CBS 102226]KIX95401.1 hypothetical protein Z520_08918 [Fonsecaea multimorphosa CBS 102226]OAL21068.1 hypothetical protein AYO22_08352 [Fonsecaea multimorphosa]